MTEPDTGAADERLKQLVGENAELNALLEQQSSAELTAPHQPIERFATLVARPQFIIVSLALFILWVVINSDLLLTRQRPWDVPPFFWLQGLIGVFSLLITTTVLVSQARQSKLAGQRADVQLQIIVLIGQRTAKLIELHEELRRDLPNVRDRKDEQAEALQQTLTPQAMLEAISDQPGPDKTS